MMTDVAVGEGAEIIGEKRAILYNTEATIRKVLDHGYLILLLTVISTGSVASLGKCRARDFT